MEEALVAHLLANTALAALVKKRIDWLKRPQGTSLPAITMQVISVSYSYTLKGRINLAERLVQIDVWGGSYGEMKAVARAVVAALDGLTAAPFKAAFIENERETTEPQDGADARGSTDFFRASLDVRVWSTDAT